VALEQVKVEDPWFKLWNLQEATNWELHAGYASAFFLHAEGKASDR
jgi:hypothetical protein